MTTDPIAARWQAKLAPVMVGAIIALTVFFSVVSVWQFRAVQAGLHHSTRAQLEQVWSQTPFKPQSYEQQLGAAVARSAFELEREVLARRYDQASSAISVRLWTRFMGFMTGMILALIGGAFVLGKLSEETSQASATLPQGLAVSFQSGSPGLVLAILGTVLMTVAMSVPATIDMRDAPVYFGQSGAASYVPSQAPTDSIGPPGRAATSATSGTDALIAEAPPVSGRTAQ